MREHPIPQDITGYRFHIIGSMTLKQFVEIALGVIVGVIFYSTNLPAVIKFPLIILSVVLGGMAAFLPIEERPLDHWIITFVKAMYRPTQFFWRREPTIPESLTHTASTTITTVEPEIDLGPAKKQRIREYMTAVPNTTDPYALESTETTRISAILETFSATTTPVVATPVVAQVEKPQLSVRVRNFRPPHIENLVYSAEAAPTETPTPPQSVLYQEPQLTKQQQPVDTVATEIPIPETEEIHVPSAIEHGAAAAAVATPTANGIPMTFMEPEQPIAQQLGGQEVDFNVNLPFPESPQEPNKLVGMVLTPRNELITNAIVEVKTPTGTIMRAVKTNALGQFFVTTPLDSGEYLIFVEKDGYQFEPQHLTLIGEPVAPIEVRSLG